VVEVPGGYILCEYESVKKEFPEFKAVMDRLRSDLISKASEEWGIPVDRFTLEAGYLTTVMPQLFVDNTGVRLTTWDQWFTATGHRLIMAGVGNGNSIPEDYKVGLAGLAFLDKAIRVSEVKMQISDKKLPRINIEEAFVYNKPAIVFEEGFILDEETAFELYAYVLTQGPQRIKLIGLQANRVKDKLLTTDTGAALT
jgi:hypothetical protein